MDIFRRSGLVEGAPEDFERLLSSDCTIGSEIRDCKNGFQLDFRFFFPLLLGDESRRISSVLGQGWCGQGSSGPRRSCRGHKMVEESKMFRRFCKASGFHIFIVVRRTFEGNFDHF